MPRVLFLMPTRTYRARAFLAAAEKLGIEAVVGSERQQALEPFTGGTTVTLNFQSVDEAVERLVQFARQHPIDAIIPVDEDTAVLAAAASRALGLRHNSVAAALAAREKHRMRQLLRAHNIPAPEAKLLPVDAEPAKVAETVEFPCVLKPIFLASSRGVIRADSAAEFIRAFERLTAILAEPEVKRRGGALAETILVEPYIPGEEVVLEGLLTAGRLKVLAIYDKPDPLEGPYFEETIYVTPSRQPEAVQKRVAEGVSAAAAAMGIRHGPVHAELRINDRGVWVIEIAARSIGGLCASTLRFGRDISLEELIIRHALGDDVEGIQREAQAAGVMMIPIPRAGILEEVLGLSEALKVEGVEDVKITIPRSQKVVPLPEGDRYLGFIFSRGQTPEEVESALRTAHRRLTFVIV